jgi:Cd2+/Zn2+-exporting ATPase
MTQENHMQEYRVKNIDCPDCAVDIENGLRKMKGMRFVSLNFATSKIRIDADNADELLTRINTMHPDVVFEEITSKTNTIRQEQPKKYRAYIYLLLISATLYIFGLVSQGSLADTPYSWAEYFVFLSAYILCGHKILLNAAKNIVRGQLFDENFLMSLATICAIAIHSLPEAVGVMIFYRVGMLLQAMSLDRSRRSISALLELRPEYANIITASGIEKVRPEDVTVGSIVLVKPGERIPIDGKVKNGDSLIDTSALSGEPKPRTMKPGDTVLAGMINKTSTLEVEVTANIEESYLSKVLHITENALHKKTKTEQFITKFARFYTPIVIAAAILIAVIPPLVSDMNFRDSLYRALVLLVISCPCALMLSIPLGYYGGIGKAAKKGILIKGSNYLDILARVKTIVFDKTRTLTKGSFKVRQVVTKNGSTEEEVVALAIAAESHSSHPIASSLFEHAGTVPDPTLVSSYREKSGEGVIAVVEDMHVIAGNHKILHSEGIEHECIDIPGTAVHVAANEQYKGYIVISDEIKEDSKQAIDELVKLKITDIHMLSGDSEKSTEHIASSLGITKYHSWLMPDEKVTKLEEIMKAGGSRYATAFIGDGINDAPALARADVGIAMGEFGTDAAIDTADIVLSTDSPMKIPEAIRIAKKTKNIVKENIVFALTVKLAFIVLGGLGISGMWEAVFADMGVSLIAVFNAMRVLR